MSEALTNFRFRIAGCGTALPSVALTNETLAGQLGVEEGWIMARCGIEQRYQSNLEETTLSLAVEASRKALEFDPAPDPDLLLCSTFTPQYMLCPTAPAIAARRSAKRDVALASKRDGAVAAIACVDFY